MMQPDPLDPLTGGFWAGALARELRVSWCAGCDRAVWYPRPQCERCGGALHWQALSGEATLIAWSEVSGPINPDFATPYISALVSPREAPHIRLVTRLVDCEAQNLQCDMPVRVCFRELKPLQGAGFMAPVFTPA